MYKKFKDYRFDELAGHFVLIKNTKIVKNPEAFSYIDRAIERTKKDIIETTKQYYKEKYDFDDTIDYNDNFSIESLNESMTTRTVKDLYEPMYGYFCIEKTRGYILCLLGNDEDKLRYVCAPLYFLCDSSEPFKDDIEIEIIDDSEFENALLLKEHLQDDEELDEDVINTRKLKNLDIYRTEFSPDYVSCIVSYKNNSYTAKVKLSKYENGTIYAKYHDQEGILNLVESNGTSFLTFNPLKTSNESKALKKYIHSIIDGLMKDYFDCGMARETATYMVKTFKDEIEEAYINGDLPFEIIHKMWDLIEDCDEELSEDDYYWEEFSKYENDEDDN